MTNKLRVRDLAAELGVSNKDILHTLRQIGIQVRSHMSGLTDEEVAQVRSEMSKATTTRSEVIRKEVQPGVIVRRRKTRRPKGKRAQDAEEASVEAQSAEEPEIQAAPEPESVDAKPSGQPVVEDDKDEAPKQEAAPVKDTPPAQTGEPAPSTARIVQPPVQEQEPPAPAPQDEPQEPEVEPAEQEVEAPAPVTASEPEDVPQEPETPADSEAPEVEAEPEAKQQTPAPKQAEEPESDAKQAKEDQDDVSAKDKPDAKAKKKKRKKKKPEAQETPQVRIISMPDPTPAPTRAPASRPPRPGGPGRPAGGRPSGPRPGGPGRPASPRPGGGRPGFAPAPPPPGDAQSRKKRKKDRRVVDFASDSDRRGAGKKGRKQLNEHEDRFRNRRGPKRKKRGGAQEEAVVTTQPLKAAKRKLRIEDAIRVADMAKQMGLKAQELIKVLFGMGVMATINQSLDFETAVLVASEFGYEVENVAFAEDDYLLPKEEDKPEQLKGRPPVVTIMGHVDHGKTSLLDAIRKTNITDGEAGGITQHIGAYHVATNRGEIVFLDTPGHEAFTTMRARGAQVTDLVVLVVAADDGVMDQTREAINHSRAAEVPILVAVNKIDKEDANPDRVKRELSDFDLVAEDWGGDTIFANVSAKQGTGIDELLELILLQAEVLELKANPDKPARGHIVEAKLDKGRGPVGTLLIQEGTLKQNDPFVCGLFSGRVRAMFNDQGQKIPVAGPAMPVEVQGFDGVPEAGDEFVCVNDDKVARRIADDRQMKQREKELAGKSKVTLESFLASKPTDQEAQNLNLVVKADVQGSLEAIIEALGKLGTEEVQVNVIHGGAGAITESDILLANASQAIIIGFNVRPTAKIKDIAENEHVEIRFYEVIYKLVGEIRDAMSGMLAPDIEEVYLGQAEVRQTFSVPKVGTVAGCAVADGKLTRNANIRLLRDGVVIYTGKLDSLKRFKDDAKEVLKGYECGVGLEKYNDIKVGDIIEAFEEKEVARTLDQ